MRSLVEDLPGLNSGESAAFTFDHLLGLLAGTDQLLRALAAWYTNNSVDLFDQNRSALEPAEDRAAAAARAIRALADDVRTASRTSDPVLLTLRELDLRSLYTLTKDEAADEDELFVVREVSLADADERDVRWAVREDVARWHAREVARTAPAGARIELVHVLEGEQLPEPLGTWSGQGEDAAV